VLRTFFVARIKHIARRNNPQALAQWCSAILGAHMRDEDKVECCEALLTAHPNLINELLDEKSRHVAEVLADVAVDARRSDLLPRSRVSELRAVDRPRRLLSRGSEEELRRFWLRKDEQKYIRQLEAEVEYYGIAAERGECGRLLDLNLGERYERRLLISGENLGSRRLGVLDLDSTLGEADSSAADF